jgi:uncharacterized Tic20 family protein
MESCKKFTTMKHPPERLNDSELERASNGYLMSLIALMAGMPLPIINLLASMIFFFSNRRSSYFVRWHCTQTLVSQLTLLVCNSIGFSWTMAILFGPKNVSNAYVSYIITVVLFNLFEFIFTIAAAVRARKGASVYWWFWGPLTDMICKPDPLHTSPTIPSRP